jgi:hypothetical protein
MTAERKSKASADMAAGLETEVVLGKGAHVMITRNLWQRNGLGDYSDGDVGENFTCSIVFTGIVNATVGTVEDIIWECGAESSDLPLAVLVSCKDYKGPTVWRTEARERLPLGIPIVPLKTSFESRSQTMARTQLPLRLAWAVTASVHTSQSLTLCRRTSDLSTGRWS